MDEDHPLEADRTARFEYFAFHRTGEQVLTYVRDDGRRIYEDPDGEWRHFPLIWGGAGVFLQEDSPALARDVFSSEAPPEEDEDPADKELRMLVKDSLARGDVNLAMRDDPDESIHAALVVGRAALGKVAYRASPYANAGNAKKFAYYDEKMRVWREVPKSERIIAIDPGKVVRKLVVSAADFPVEAELHAHNDGIAFAVSRTASGSSIGSALSAGSRMSSGAGAMRNRPINSASKPKRVPVPTVKTTSGSIASKAESFHKDARKSSVTSSSSSSSSSSSGATAAANSNSNSNSSVPRSLPARPTLPTRPKLSRSSLSNKALSVDVGDADGNNNNNNDNIKSQKSNSNSNIHSGTSSAFHARDNHTASDGSEPVKNHISASMLGAEASGLRPKSPMPSGTKIQWVKGELIGKGAHGMVYQGLEKTTGKLIAVKMVDLTTLASDASLAAIAREMELLKDLHHTHVVQYLGSDVEDGHLHIFLEFVPGGSLASMLERFGAFSESIAKIYLKQILIGCEYLHENNVVHRDIKAENILMDTTGVVKLADFGCSKIVIDGGSECKSFLGTPYFLAPEVVKETSYDEKSDVWSIGCTVIQLLSGKPPWSELNNAFAVVFKIGNTDEPPMYPPNISPNAKDFLDKCLAIDPKKRPSVAELLHHPWFDDDEDNQ